MGIPKTTLKLEHIYQVLYHIIVSIIFMSTRYKYMQAIEVLYLQGVHIKSVLNRNSVTYVRMM